MKIVLQQQQKGKAMQQREWLDNIKKMVMSVVERETLFGDVCPSYNPTVEEKRDVLKKLVVKNSEISDLIERTLEIETTDFGISLILPKNQMNPEIALVLYLSVSARLDGGLGRMFRQVSDYVSHVAHRDPTTALQVRNLFRCDSPIHELIAMEKDIIVLDDAKITLRESAFNKAVGNTSDLSEKRCEAEFIRLNRWY